MDSFPDLLIKESPGILKKSESQVQPLFIALESPRGMWDL